MHLLLVHRHSSHSHVALLSSGTQAASKPPTLVPACLTGRLCCSFWGAINLCQLVGRHMAAQRSGHIVNIGSIASDVTTILNAFCERMHACRAVVAAVYPTCMHASQPHGE